MKIPGKNLIAPLRQNLAASKNPAQQREAPVARNFELGIGEENKIMDSARKISDMISRNPIKIL
jgi:hypothetical protein